MNLNMSMNEAKFLCPECLDNTNKMFSCRMLYPAKTTCFLCKIITHCKNVEISIDDNGFEELLKMNNTIENLKIDIETLKLLVKDHYS